MLWKATKYAVGGSFERANTLGPVLGGFIIWAVMGGLGMSMALPSDVGGALLLLVSTLGTAWLLIVVVRFLYWPWTALPNLRQRSSAVSSNPGNDAWQDGVMLERVYNRKFTNETVALDGRHFVNPVFDSVTFFYQGTGPVFLENPTYVLHGGKMGSRLATRNKVVGMALKIHDNLLKAGGLPAQLIDFGPDATFDAPKSDGLPVTPPVFSGDDEAPSIYEGSHEKLMNFVVKELFYACESRDDVHNAIIRGLCSNGPLAELAQIGARHHSNIWQMRRGLEVLHRLATSPPEFIPFDEMIDAVSSIEHGYLDFLFEGDRIAMSGHLDPKDRENIVRLWETWRIAHNEMVDAYEAIKRDSKMLKLFRPARESRWGGIIPPVTIADGMPLALLLRAPGKIVTI